jgi:hypothetical protein
VIHRKAFLGRPICIPVNQLPSRHTLRLKSVVPQSRNFSYHRARNMLKLPTLVFPSQRLRRGTAPQAFDITGQRETLEEASLLFTIHLMHLTTQDQHELRLDPMKVPSPHFKESYTFQLPVGFSIS